jgi:hypothetical protein
MRRIHGFAYDGLCRKKRCDRLVDDIGIDLSNDAVGLYEETY